MKKIAVFCLAALAAVTIMLTGCANNGKSNNGEEEPSTPTVNISAEGNMFNSDIVEMAFWGHPVSSYLVLIETEDFPKVLEHFTDLEFVAVDEDQRVKMTDPWQIVVLEIFDGEHRYNIEIDRSGIVQYFDGNRQLYQSTTKIDYEAFTKTMDAIDDAWY